VRQKLKTSLSFNPERHSLSVSVVLLLLSISFSFFFFSPHQAEASHCEEYRPFEAEGYLFDNYQDVEYSIDGYLIIHLKIKNTFYSDRPWTSRVKVLNDDCDGGSSFDYKKEDVSLSPGTEYFSFRFTSPTHYDIWNDDLNIPETCASCSGDIDLFPGFYEVLFWTIIPGDFSHVLTSSFRIRNDEDDAPIISETLPTPEQCAGQTLFTRGRTFSPYEKVEYVDGLLRYHFRFNSPFNWAFWWRSKLVFHDENCIPKQSLRPDFNTQVLPPYTRYYSVRFSSPTHYDIWSDESNTIVPCPACSVDITEENPFSYVSFSGEQAYVSYFRSTPFPILEEDYEEKLDPVIFIPGILGSWEKNGEWVIDPVLHTFDDIIKTFELNGYVLGETLFTFPYDWRISNVLTAVLLRDKINEVQEICECEKVDLVAHSMGGLVSRQYIQSPQYEDDVDQLIFLGTPHLGSPKAYLTWEGGEISEKANLFTNAQKFILKREGQKLGYENLFDYIRNKPIVSVEQLLPIFDYIRDKDIDILREYPEMYPQNTFLENLNNNISQFFSAGIKISNIVGNLGDRSTIQSIKVIDSEFLPKWEHGYPDHFYDTNSDQGLEFGVGDKTVPLYSASFIVDDLTIISSIHNGLPKNAQAIVFEKLTKKDPVEISDTYSLPNIKLLILKILSPVDVQVITPDGKKIGKNFETGEEINEIDGAFYSGFLTDNEYVTIINPLDGDYKVITEGTDDGGEYTVATAYITEEGNFENDFSSYIIPNTTEEIKVLINTENPEESGMEETTIITLETLQEQIELLWQLGWITDEDYKENLQNIIHSMTNLGDDVKGKQKLLGILFKRLDIGLKKNFISENGYNVLKEDLNLLTF